MKIFLCNDEASSQAAWAEEFSIQDIVIDKAACLAAQPFTQNFQVPLRDRGRLRVPVNCFHAASFLDYC